MVIGKERPTRPGDPSLTELMVLDIQVSYGFRISNMMFVQCLSSRFLKVLTVLAATTNGGNEFQSFTTLVLNATQKCQQLDNRSVSSWTTEVSVAGHYGSFEDWFCTVIMFVFRNMRMTRSQSTGSSVWIHRSPHTAFYAACCPEHLS